MMEVMQSQERLSLELLIFLFWEVNTNLLIHRNRDLEINLLKDLLSSRSEQ